MTFYLMINTNGDKNKAVIVSENDTKIKFDGKPGKGFIKITCQAYGITYENGVVRSFDKEEIIKKVKEILK